MKRILPTWCKEVKKSMIDDDINVTELAERVGFSRNYVSGVVNGRVYAPEIAKVIGEDRHVTLPILLLLMNRLLVTSSHGICLEMVRSFQS